MIFCFFVWYNLLGQSTLESLINLNFNLGSSLLLLSSGTGKVSLSFSKTGLNTLIIKWINKKKSALQKKNSYLDREFFKRTSFDSIDVERAIRVNGSETTRDLSRKKKLTGGKTFIYMCISYRRTSW